jgi:hypothetical protein
MTFKEAGHILGLPSQGEEIRGPPKKHVPELFNKYALKDSTAIYYTRMKDYFKDNESYDDDFVRLFVLFCIGFYLCPTLQTYVKSDYLGLIEDIDNIKNLNWTSLVVNYLISSIREYKEQKATNLKGNLALLQVCILLIYLKLHEIILYSQINIFLNYRSGTGKRCLYLICILHYSSLRGTNHHSCSIGMKREPEKDAN